MPTHTQTIAPEQPPMSLRDRIAQCPSPKKVEALLETAASYPHMSNKTRTRIAETAKRRLAELEQIAQKRAAKKTKKKGGE